MKVTKNSVRKREENVTETKTDKSRILVHFLSDFGMLLATFWGPKTLHFLMRFLKSFLGAEADRRVSDGTSAGLRRDFDGTSTQLFPPAAPSSRTEESNNDRKERKTRDPTRPGPEARRIFSRFLFLFSFYI